MANGLLALLLGLALQFGSGALASLRPMAGLRGTPTPTAANMSLWAAAPQAEGPVTATLAVGGDFGFCLGTDPQVLREAAAGALGLAPEQLAEEIRGGRTLGEVADDQGVSRETLLAALQGAAQDSLRTQLEPLAEAGELTPEQVDALLALQGTRDLAYLLDLPMFFAVPGTFEVERGEWPDFGPGLGGLPPFGEAPLLAVPGGMSFSFRFSNGDGEPFVFELKSATPEVQAALAEALGLSVADLAARLDGGERLGDIAVAQGVDEVALREAWRTAGVAKARAELDAAAADGRMTRAEADDILTQVERALSGERLGPGGLRPGSVFGAEERWPFGWEEEARPVD